MFFSICFTYFGLCSKISFCELDAAQRKQITDTMAKITEQTKYNAQKVITFRPRNRFDVNYVEFVKGSGCSSLIGQSPLEESK